MSDTTTVTLRSYYPYPFLVDADDDTQVIPLRIARFTVEQGKAFSTARARVMDPPSLRCIYRQPDGDEQEQVEITNSLGTGKRFVIADDEVRRRRLAEMTVEGRAWFDEQSARDTANEYDFLVDAVTQYLSVDPKAHVRFVGDDDVAVELRTGADLARVFGGNLPQLHRLVTAIWAENTLKPLEKKTWRSLSASRFFSDAPAPAAAGPKPDGTAAPAASVGSAAHEGATESREPNRSGSSTTSRSTRARSSSSRRSSRKSSAGSPRRTTSSSASAWPAGT